MKELTIQEKAKRYDEAIEIANEINNEHKAQSFDVMLKVFPELKESEDEKILRTLKEIVNWGCAKNISVENGVELKDCLAWLEKQGEKETTYDKDMLGAIEYCIKNNRPLEKEHIAWLEEKKGEQKVEVKYVYTKFRIGDVIVEIKSNGYCQPVTVKYIGEGAYSCESDDGKRYLSFPIINQDEYKLVEQKTARSEDEFAHIVGYLVQDIVANEHTPEEEKQPTKFFVEKYYNKLRPQDTWKPSDVQMRILSIYADQNNTHGAVLTSLYQDLKKLK